MKISFGLFAAAAVSSTAVVTARMAKPLPMTLHSAYTPFGPLPEQKLNLTGIPSLAKRAKFLGVNTVFVSGSMSEFDTMTVAERKVWLFVDVCIPCVRCSWLHLQRMTRVCE